MTPTDKGPEERDAVWRARRDDFLGGLLYRQTNATRHGILALLDRYVKFIGTHG
ncbi:MAG TPA: hypothetical protein VEG62_05845 [Acidimicrobiales bacterium]|nr:hypothetical protein [Acidimicrobiales bacterium]